MSENRLTVWFAPSGSLLDEWTGAAWNGFNSQLARQLCPSRLCQWISSIILTFLLLTEVSVWLLKSPYSVKPRCHMAVKRQVTWLHSEGQPTPVPDSPSCLSPPEPPSCYSDISRFKRLPWPFQNNQFSIPDRSLQNNCYSIVLRPFSQFFSFSDISVQIYKHMHTYFTSTHLFSLILILLLFRTKTDFTFRWKA